MVMGRDSRSEGRGFESWHRIMDGHFFTYISYKNCIVYLKKTKNKRKRGWGWPIFLKKIGNMSIVKYFYQFVIVGHWTIF